MLVLCCAVDCQAALDMAITFLCSLQYLQWAGLDPMGDADMFWTSPRVKQLYMNHVRVLFNRRNVYTGLLYKVRCHLMLLLGLTQMHTADRYCLACWVV